MLHQTTGNKTVLWDVVWRLLKLLIQGFVKDVKSLDLLMFLTFGFVLTILQ